jgi:hypothetical protein
MWSENLHDTASQADEKITTRLGKPLESVGGRKEMEN